jgi:hypothetical protein
MKIIAYGRNADSELALLRHLSHLRRTDSLKRFQQRLLALKATAKARALAAQTKAGLLGEGLGPEIDKDLDLARL